MPARRRAERCRSVGVDGDRDDAGQFGHASNGLENVREHRERQLPARACNQQPCQTLLRGGRFLDRHDRPDVAIRIHVATTNLSALLLSGGRRNRLS